MAAVLYGGLASAFNAGESRRDPVMRDPDPGALDDFRPGAGYE